MIYAMSDIHGCLEELEKKMELVDLSGNNRIVELLKVQPGATTKEIVEKLEITNNQVKYYIKN